jgi:ankyrin repeat protein
MDATYNQKLLLLKFGADPNMPEMRNSCYSLHQLLIRLIATTYSTVDPCLELLLRYGADPHARSYRGAGCGRQESCINLTSIAEAHPDDRKLMNRNWSKQPAPERIAPLHELLLAITIGDYARITQLLKAVNINASGTGGQTPLMHAIYNGWHTNTNGGEPREMVEFLLKNKADPNALHYIGHAPDSSFPNGVTTPLVWAIRHNRPIEVLDLLICYGADVNGVYAIQEGGGDCTPLFAAAAWAKPEVVAFLLSKGADNAPARGYVMCHLLLVFSETNERDNPDVSRRTAEVVRLLGLTQRDIQAGRDRLAAWMREHHRDPSTWIFDPK